LNGSREAVANLRDGHYDTILAMRVAEYLTQHENMLRQVVVANDLPAPQSVDDFISGRYVARAKR
jgi:hypothetical protein